MKAKTNSIKFQQLTKEQQQQVREKINHGQDLSEHKRFVQASDVYRELAANRLESLSEEPLTTGALFVVAGAFLDFAADLLHDIMRVQRGTQDYIGDGEDGGFRPHDIMEVEWSEELLRRYDKDVDQAYYERSEAESDDDAAQEKLLDEVANRMFGNGNGVKPDR